VFTPVKVLPDGSFHSVMRTPGENVRHGQAGLVLEGVSVMGGGIALFGTWLAWPDRAYW
jgi:hypothetical protein